MLIVAAAFLCKCALEALNASACSLLASRRAKLGSGNMHALLKDSSVPVLVSEASVARSTVLQQAWAAEPEADATVRLPCDQAVWDDWEGRTSGTAPPLAVARVGPIARICLCPGLARCSTKPACCAAKL